MQVHLKHAPSVQCPTGRFAAVLVFPMLFGGITFVQLISLWPTDHRLKWAYALLAVVLLGASVWQWLRTPVGVLAWQGDPEHPDHGWRWWPTPIPLTPTASFPPTGRAIRLDKVRVFWRWGPCMGVAARDTTGRIRWWWVSQSWATDWRALARAIVAHGL